MGAGPDASNPDAEVRLGCLTITFLILMGPACFVMGLFEMGEIESATARELAVQRFIWALIVGIPFGVAGAMWGVNARRRTVDSEERARYLKNVATVQAAGTFLGALGLLISTVGDPAILSIAWGLGATAFFAYGLAVLSYEWIGDGT